MDITDILPFQGDGFLEIGYMTHGVAVGIGYIGLSAHRGALNIGNN